MEFKYRNTDQQATAYVPRSSGLSYFAEQSLRARFSAPLLSHGREYYGSPTDMREAVWRELEKERIREEIITEEIVRRRILEAEVRRELMMEMEFALRRDNGSSSFPWMMDLESRLSHFRDRSKGRSLEERIALSLAEKLRTENSSMGVTRCGLSGLEVVPFQQRVLEPRVSEVVDVSDVSSEKEKVVLTDKPGINISGSKRKAVSAAAESVSELPSADVSKKKAKVEWSCALCQVNATSEVALSEHLQGKRHKSKEAGLKGHIGLGVFPRRLDTTTKLLGTSHKKTRDDISKIECTKEDNKRLKVNNGLGLFPKGPTKLLGSSDGSAREGVKSSDTISKTEIRKLNSPFMLTDMAINGNARYPRKTDAVWKMQQINGSRRK